MTMSECRVCLRVDNVEMHLISETRYQEIYEKFSGSLLRTEDGIPNKICHNCNSQLQKFYKFIEMSEESERILTKRLLDSSEISQANNSRGNSVHNPAMTLAQSMSYVENGEEIPEVIVTIKEEPLDHEIEQFKEEYLDSPPADEAIPADSNREPTPNGLFGVIPKTQPEELPAEIPEPTLWPDLSNIDHPMVSIKTEVTESEESNAIAEAFLRNLGLTVNIPLKQSPDLKYYPNTETSGNPEKKYFCNLCQYKSYTMRALRTHTKVHDQSFKYSCKFCSYRFITEKKLASHRNFCTVCNICGKKFSNTHGLRIHIRLHTGIQPFSCDTCGRGFNQKTNLQTHMRVHSRDAQFPCHVCNKIFPFRTYLKRHMLIHGKNPLDMESFHRILNCHKLFNQKKDRSCICSVCGRVLQTNKSLSMHMKLHTGDKPFSCERCGKVFIQKCNLLTHVERIHTLDELFSCSICHKIFPLNCEMIRHLLTHLGTISAKDFEIFQQKHLYNIHRKSYNGQLTPYPCDICKTRVLSY